MEFPDKYILLHNQTVKKGNYKIVPIRYEDRLAIMNWRNEQIYHLRQSKALTEKDQENYFTNILSKTFNDPQPGQILFSYLENDSCIGYGGLVHINWTDKNAEISFIMNTALEKEHFHFHWYSFLDLLEEIAFKELSLHKIYTYAFDIRPHLYKVLEDKKYIREATLKEHCLIDNKFHDVVIHSKTNISIRIREAKETDMLTIFEWVNDDLVRQNSINKEKIALEDHIHWFKNKLSDNSSYFLIGEYQGKPIGYVRFDATDDYLILNYLIRAECRGKNLGKSLIDHSLAYLAKKTDKNIYAYVDKFNIPSNKVLSTFLTPDGEKEINSVVYNQYKGKLNER